LSSSRLSRCLHRPETCASTPLMLVPMTFESSQRATDRAAPARRITFACAIARISRRWS
jgi:hypothetical protein